jgi:hypothetical protein
LLVHKTSFSKLLLAPQSTTDLFCFYRLIPATPITSTAILQNAVEVPFNLTSIKKDGATEVERLEAIKATINSLGRNAGVICQFFLSHYLFSKSWHNQLSQHDAPQLV